MAGSRWAARPTFTVVEQTPEVTLPDAASHSIFAPRYEPTLVLHHGAPVDIVPWRGLT